MKGILFANGDIKDYTQIPKYLSEKPVIICVDGGMRHTYELGMTPDYILGDFDSVSPEILEYYKEKNVPLKQYPEHKDETDMELGLRLVLELNITDLIIFGGIGSRMDHTLANCHLLYFLLKNQVRGRLINENNCVEIIDRYLKVTGKKGDLVSLIPAYGEVRGVTLHGMEYPLQNATIPFFSPIGVSNVMLKEEAEIFVEEGLLFVILAKDE